MKRTAIRRTRMKRGMVKSLRAKHDPKMVAWSKDVLERDDHHCRWPGCHEQGPHVHAHHIQTRKQRPDLKYTRSNGAAICFIHHDRLHHTVEGRQEARALGLLGGTTYEKAQKMPPEISSLEA